MDSLTPDKDDLERFRRERKRTAAPASTAAPQETPLAARREPAAKPDLVSTPAAKPSVRAEIPRKETPSRSGSSWTGALALVLAISLAGAGVWLYGQQRSTIAQLESQLAEANQYINQSQQILARLEGSLNETEATVQQSDSKLSARLAGIDSEIRKLWDLANKRQAAQLKEHQGKLDGLQTSTKQLQERLTKAEQGLASATKTASEQTAKLATGLQSIEELNTKLGRLETSSGEQISQLSKDYQAQIAALTQRVEAMRTKLDSQTSSAPLEKRLKEVETAINAIDMNRQQVNQRIVDLERRLNEAQLQLKALTPVSGG